MPKLRLIDPETQESYVVDQTDLETDGGASAIEQLKTSIAPKTFAGTGGSAGASGTQGTGQSGTSGGQGYNTSGGYGAIPTGGPSINSSEGGGTDQVSAVFSAVDKVFQDILGVAGEIRQGQALQANTDLGKRQMNINERTANLAQQLQRFNIGQSREDMKLKKAQDARNAATTQEGLATSGQARSQSSIAFNESQKDRRSGKEFLAALASGFARGLAERPTGRNLSQPTVASVLPTIANPSA